MTVENTIAAMHVELTSMLAKAQARDDEISALEGRAVESRKLYNSCLDAGDSAGMAAALDTIAKSKKAAESLRTARGKPAFLTRLAEIESQQGQLLRQAGDAQQAADAAVEKAAAGKLAADDLRRRVAGLQAAINAVREQVS